jgi:hypothetical protein
MNKLIKPIHISLLSLLLMLSTSFVTTANDEPSPEIPEGIVKLTKVNQSVM